MAEYFIHPDGPIDPSSGDMGSLGNPFGQIQEGIDEAINPGDIVSIIHDPAASNPIHIISSTISCINSGTALNPIIIRGVDVNGDNTPFSTIAQVHVDVSGFPIITGGGINIICSDLDLGAWNDNVFTNILQWKVMRVRQVLGTAVGVSVWGSAFENQSRGCLFLDCEQIVSRSQFSSNGNTVQGNVYYRCYSNFTFAATGDRKTAQHIYCVSNGAAIGFNIDYNNYNTIGGTLHGCIAINCGIGFRFQSGGILVSKCVAYNSTGNGIELDDTTVASSLVITDSIIMNSGGYGLERLGTTSALLHEERNTWYNNSSGNIKDSTIGSLSSTEDPLIDPITLQLSIDSPARRKQLDIGSYYSTKVDSGAINSEDLGGGSICSRVVTTFYK